MNARCRLYVETNFVLEVTLQQEQAPAAEELLRKAEAGDLELAIPEFSLAEAYARTRQLGNRYADLHFRLQDEVIRELSRSAHYAEVSRSIDPILAALRDWRAQQLDRLDQTIGRILVAARCLGLDAPVFERAIDLSRRFGLSTPDSIVLATVVADLQSGAPLRTAFASRDTQFHDDPLVRAELQALSCRCIPRFSDAQAFLTSGSRPDCGT